MNWKHHLLIVILVLPAFGLLWHGPVEQNELYHHFADTRIFFYVPNFFDVVSNFAFLIVGIIGLRNLPSNNDIKLGLKVFFTSMILVAFGSGYYHYQPNSQTLFWDRLPLAISFTSLLWLMTKPVVGNLYFQLLKWPLILLGPASVIHWAYFSDLRIYLYIQFGGILYILLLALMFDIEPARKKYLSLTLGFYTLAKISEILDHQIFSITKHILSGHTFKHLLAAIGAFYVSKIFHTPEKKL